MRHGGRRRAYRELAVKHTETVPRHTRLPVAVPPVEVTRPRAVRVEGAVRAAPHAALPCRPDQEGHRLAGHELEPAQAGPETALRADAGPDRVGAVVGHAQGHVRLVRPRYATGVLGTGVVYHGGGQYDGEAAAEEAMPMARLSPPPSGVIVLRCAKQVWWPVVADAHHSSAWLEHG